MLFEIILGIGYQNMRHFFDKRPSAKNLGPQK